MLRDTLGRRIAEEHLDILEDANRRLKLLILLSATRTAAKPPNEGSTFFSVGLRKLVCKYLAKASRPHASSLPRCVALSSKQRYNWLENGSQVLNSSISKCHSDTLESVQR